MTQMKSGNSTLRLPELLAPAGNFEKMKTAIHYGADAIYLGGKQFSLRAKAGNFEAAAMQEAISYAHDHGVKVYVTVNILAHNHDLLPIPKYLSDLQKMGADGVIVADPGILAIARSTVPELPVHLSTQANVTNGTSARFWQEQGVARLNLARELSLAEISEIRRQTGAELEVFVHGALCISYSGRCLLSSYMTGRDANQGNCAHPCRYSYALVEEKRPGQYFPVEEDERGTYIFNAKDLCLLEALPLLIASGVDSLKIEGRMKSIFYVGGVVRVYRAALDFLQTVDSEQWKTPEHIAIPREYVDEIMRTGTRGVTSNFLASRPGAGEMNYLTSRVEQSHEPVAVVRIPGQPPLVEVRNTMAAGTEVEYMAHGLGTLKVKVVALQGEDGQPIPKANPGNLVYLVCEPPLASTEPLGILRRRIT